jgi:hypothetical protein
MFPWCRDFVPAFSLHHTTDVLQAPYKAVELNFYFQYSIKTSASHVITRLKVQTTNSMKKSQTSW